jgi:hypothetical protein
VPLGVADKIPDAVAKIEADEQQIIGVCQASGVTAQKLKDLYAKIRPGPY